MYIVPKKNTSISLDGKVLVVYGFKDLSFDPTTGEFLAGLDAALVDPEGNQIHLHNASLGGSIVNILQKVVKVGDRAIFHYPAWGSPWLVMDKLYIGAAET